MTDPFIAIVAREASISEADAERATQAVLTTLAERISSGQAYDLARELPEHVRAHLESDGPAQRFDLEEFVRRVAEREATDPETARRHAEAVFAALGAFARPRELRDTAAELPQDFGPLIAVALAGPQHREEPPSPRLSADEFIARVASRSGLSRDQARRATEAVLEALADRISAGEVDDLEAELPDDLRAPLERGKELTHGAALPLSLDQFVRLIAELEGVPPREAREHARAVFATLRQAVSPNEIDDVVAQLPKDYAAVLAPA